MALLSRMLYPALILAALPALALVEERPATPKGEWQVGMMPGAKKDQFGYCLMRAPYDNGLTMAIALSPKGEVNIGVQVPKASFGKEEKFPMKVSIDGGMMRARATIAVQSDLLLTPMGADAEILSALRKGKVLTMEGPQDTAFFALKGTSRGLTKLQQCVDVGTGKIKPEAAAQAGAKGGKTANGKVRAFPPGLMQLLQASGLKDIEVVPIADPAKAPVDFAWRTQGVFGGVRERPMPKDVTIEKMSELIENGFKGQCKGAFKANMGAIETLPGLKLRTGDISCEAAEGAAHVALLLYLTDTNLFSMFMHEAPLDKKDGAMQARDSITGTIRELTQKQDGAAKPAEPPAESSAVAPASPPPPAVPVLAPEKTAP